ncbi:MAG: uroporphyrinogen decarboxylase family protein [Planctomycetota bacterium]|jgi:MtaA/CmuA family methyltransferase
MNSFERYTGVLKKEKVDYLPRIPILMQFAAEYVGSDYGRFAADYKVLAEANETCALDFGIDQLSTISDPYRETQGFGSKVEYVSDGPPRSNHPLAESKDLTVLQKPDPMSSERMLDRVNAVEQYKKNNGDNYSILGWVEGPAAEGADLRGVTTFLMDMMEDEVFSCDLMDLCVDTAIDFARAQIKMGADTIGMGDAIASQISPDIYDKMIQPREKKIVDAIHEAGAYAKLHICGNITHLLPGIADLGIDVLDVDHLVDLKTVRDTVGDKVAIAGNFDPVGVIHGGTPEQIKDAVKKAYETVGNPYMVNAGCEIPSGTPVENLKALCEPVEFII